MHHGDDLVENRTREASLGAQCSNRSANSMCIEPAHSCLIFFCNFFATWSCSANLRQCISAVIPSINIYQVFYFRCNVNNSAFPACSNSTAVALEKTYIPSSELLSFYGADTPAWACIVAILVTMVVFRIIGYYLIRLLHKPIIK